MNLHEGKNLTARFIGSISAALSSPVYVTPREESSGEERGPLSRTAAGKSSLRGL